MMRRAKSNSFLRLEDTYHDVSQEKKTVEEAFVTIEDSSVEASVTIEDSISEVSHINRRNISSF